MGVLGDSTYHSSWLKVSPWQVIFGAFVPCLTTGAAEGDSSVKTRAPKPKAQVHGLEWVIFSVSSALSQESWLPPTSLPSSVKLLDREALLGCLEEAFCLPYWCPKCSCPK